MRSSILDASIEEETSIMRFTPFRSGLSGFGSSACTLSRTFNRFVEYLVTEQAGGVPGPGFRRPAPRCRADFFTPPKTTRGASPPNPEFINHCELRYLLGWMFECKVEFGAL